MATASHEYLSEGELAERYGVPPRTAQRWRHTGHGPRYTKIGRRVAYRVADIEEWLATHTYASRADELARQRA